MRLWLLAALAALLWSQGTLLEGAEAKKARKRPKEMTPQHTEVVNTTLSNSEEEDENTEVNRSFLIHSPLPLSSFYVCDFAGSSELPEMINHNFQQRL